MKKILSIDAETNGLWGSAFAISAVLRNEDGTMETFVARCPIEGEVNPFVAENVLPQMMAIPETHTSYNAILKAFCEFYLANKEGATIIVHVGLPVEARLFLDAHTMGYIGDWDAPFPLVDISALPEIGCSTDTYNANHSIEMPTMEGGTHNPLYDCYSALFAYEHWMGEHSL